MVERATVPRLETDSKSRAESLHRRFRFQRAFRRRRSAILRQSCWGCSGWRPQDLHPAIEEPVPVKVVLLVGRRSRATEFPATDHPPIWDPELTVGRRYCCRGPFAERCPEVANSTRKATPSCSRAAQTDSDSAVRTRPCVSIRPASASAWRARIVRIFVGWILATREGPGRPAGRQVCRLRPDRMFEAAPKESRWNRPDQPARWLRVAQESVSRRRGHLFPCEHSFQRSCVAGMLPADRFSTQVGCASWYSRK